jgi:hypothetical protein
VTKGHFRLGFSLIHPYNRATYPYKSLLEYRYDCDSFSSERAAVLADGDDEMNRHQSRVSTFTYGLPALCLMLALAGCTTWSDERQKHYSWLYQKCLLGEHEPYTIHMNRNHNSPLPVRCREEYNHYLGSINQAL